jgi:hypothetical protein
MITEHRGAHRRATEEHAAFDDISADLVLSDIANGGIEIIEALRGQHRVRLAPLIDHPKIALFDVRESLVAGIEVHLVAYALESGPQVVDRVMDWKLVHEDFPIDAEASGDA